MANIKEIVKEKYGKIANGASRENCCDSNTSAFDFMADKYDIKEISDVEIANLGLGCGTPTTYLDLKEGMYVLDVGSGGGIDVFIASKYVGSTRKVIGLDMTEQMTNKARENAVKLRRTNVEFRLGEIEHMPIDSNSIDRVISNCVLNLVPDKHQAFSEIYRVLKPGGSFVISDIVIRGSMPEDVRCNAELWAGCIAGAMDKEEYLNIIAVAGFKDIRLLNEKKYNEVSSEKFALLSITIKGTK